MIQVALGWQGFSVSHSLMSLLHVAPVYPDPVQLQVKLSIPSIQEPVPQGDDEQSSIFSPHVFPLKPVEVRE